MTQSLTMIGSLEESHGRPDDLLTRRQCLCTQSISFQIEHRLQVPVLLKKSHACSIHGIFFVQHEALRNVFLLQNTSQLKLTHIFLEARQRFQWMRSKMINYFITESKLVCKKLGVVYFRGM